MNTSAHLATRRKFATLPYQKKSIALLSADFRLPQNQLVALREETRTMQMLQSLLHLVVLTSRKEEKAMVRDVLAFAIEFLYRNKKSGLGLEKRHRQAHGTLTQSDFPQVT